MVLIQGISKHHRALASRWGGEKAKFCRLVKMKKKKLNLRKETGMGGRECAIMWKG